MSELFLEMRNISKSFSGIRALDGINFSAKRGAVHALIGENGAGKSTLIKILSGVYQPDEGGEIIINGVSEKKLNPISSVRNGIAVIYQDFSLFQNMTVAENIALSLEIERHSKLMNWNRVKQKAKMAISQLGQNIDINAKVESLSTAKQQLVAIARALVYDAKMIVMDEPTSALSKDEVKILLDIIKSLKEKGISIIFVSHKIEELVEVSDDYTILRDGKLVGVFEKDEVDFDRIISLMVGKKFSSFYRMEKAIGETLLEVKNLSKRGQYKDISFKLHKGEILGVTGIVGAGRTEVLYAISGVAKSDSGTIIYQGKEVHINSTTDAQKMKIAFVPENRQMEGLILNQTIANNITLTILDKLKNKAGLILKSKKENACAEWMETLHIRPNIPSMEARNLSGGNQQRVVLAKCMATNPEVLLVDEPTNGIDVGAKKEIYETLEQLAKAGMGIIIVSSELPEIMAISDHILVMRKGRINASFDNNNDLTQDMIMNKAILKGTVDNKRTES